MGNGDGKRLVTLTAEEGVKKWAEGDWEGVRDHVRTCRGSGAVPRLA